MGPAIVKIDFGRAVSTFKRNASWNSKDFSCCDFPQIGGFGVIGPVAADPARGGTATSYPHSSRNTVSPGLLRNLRTSFVALTVKRKRRHIYLEHRSIEA